MLSVLAPGLMSLIVDQGRPGLSRFGVPQGGALDLIGLMALQRLLGNSERAAGVECWGGGLRLQVKKAVLAAYLGAGRVFVNAQAAPAGEVLALQSADTIEVQMGSGLVTLLAFAGGIGVKPVLGSRGLLDGAKGEGLVFRPLRQGDELPLLQAAQPRLQALPPRTLESGAIMAVPGPEIGQLGRADRRRLLEPLRVSATNRMGARLAGCDLGLQGLSASRALVFGTVQLPPAGGPILCLSGHGATGGYARVLVVSSVERARLPYLAEGFAIRFRPVSPEHARQILAADLAWAKLERHRDRQFTVRVSGTPFTTQVEERYEPPSTAFGAP